MPSTGASLTTPASGLSGLASHTWSAWPKIVSYSSAAAASSPLMCSRSLSRASLANDCPASAVSWTCSTPAADRGRSVLGGIRTPCWPAVSRAPVTRTGHRVTG